MKNVSILNLTDFNIKLEHELMNTKIIMVKILAALECSANYKAIGSNGLLTEVIKVIKNE